MGAVRQVGEDTKAGDRYRVRLCDKLRGFAPRGEGLGSELAMGGSSSCRRAIGSLRIGQARPDKATESGSLHRETGPGDAARAGLRAGTRRHCCRHVTPRHSQRGRMTRPQTAAALRDRGPKRNWVGLYSAGSRYPLTGSSCRPVASPRARGALATAVDRR